MDYRLLLMKYMDHVGTIEGTSFIDQIGNTLWPSNFTDEEVEELKRIEQEPRP